MLGTFREPLTFGWNADVTITAATEQGVRSTFNFARKGINAEIVRRLFDARPFTFGGAAEPHRS